MSDLATDPSIINQMKSCFLFFTCTSGNHFKEVMSSHIGLPALDISAAFPQATPASNFPPSGKFGNCQYFMLITENYDYHLSALSTHIN